MKLDIVANSGNDEFYTPLYAIAPILKYLKPNSAIWCPFDTRDSLFVKELIRGGGIEYIGATSIWANSMISLRYNHHNVIIL